METAHKYAPTQMEAIRAHVMLAINFLLTKEVAMVSSHPCYTLLDIVIFRYQ